MGLAGIQSKKAAFQQSFGTWAPRSPISDRLYSVDLSVLPISPDNAVIIVPGVEDFVVIAASLTVVPTADPTVLGNVQTAFPVIIGTSYDANGSPSASPGILPATGPFALAPGFGLSILANGVAQGAGQYQVLVSFSIVKLVPCDAAKPCNQS